MGPIWGPQDPGGPHVGPMNFAIWESLYWNRQQWVQQLISGERNLRAAPEAICLFQSCQVKLALSQRINHHNMHGIQTLIICIVSKRAGKYHHFIIIRLPSYASFFICIISKRDGKYHRNIMTRLPSYASFIICIVSKRDGKYHHNIMIRLPSYGILRIQLSNESWWCHQMETFSALLAICEGN